MVAYEAGYRTGKTGCIAALDGVAELVAKVEFKAGSESLVVGLLYVVTVPGLCYHKDVVRVACSLIGGIAAVIPLAQQSNVGRIVVGADTAADVLHCIQTETVHAHVDPLIGRCRQVLEAFVVLRSGNVAIVQVRHPVTEAAHIIQRFRGNVGKFYLVTAAAAEGYIKAVCHQIHGSAFLERGVTGFCAELGTRIPVWILTHQKSPVAVDFHHQIIGAVALLHELYGLVSHAVLPHVQVPAVGTVCHAFRGFVDGELGRAACNLLPFTGIVGSSLKHGEILVVR